MLHRIRVSDGERNMFSSTGRLFYRFPPHLNPKKWDEIHCEGTISTVSASLTLPNQNKDNYKSPNFISGVYIPGLLHSINGIQSYTCI